MEIAEGQAVPTDVYFPWYPNGYRLQASVQQIDLSVGNRPTYGYNMSSKVCSITGWSVERGGDRGFRDTIGMAPANLSSHEVLPALQAFG